MKLILRNLPVMVMAVAACLATQIRTSAQSPSTTYPTTTIPCPTALPPNEIEGKTITCGILTVPENYSQPQGRLIEITYAKLYSRSQSPSPDPVLDLRGGPGGSVLDRDSLRTRIIIYESLRQTRDIVLFDQRGTKFSSRLGCAPTLSIIQSFIDDKESEVGRRLNQIVANADDGDPLTPEELSIAMQICAKVLEKHGADLNQYNTPNNARDAINLVTALGHNTKVNLYGISYGTYLAAQIVRDFPDKIRSVVLDSSVPPQDNKYESIPLANEVVLLNLIADCEADRACNTAYPNLKERTIDLVKTIVRTPIPLPTATDPNSKITAEAFTGLVEKLNSNPKVAPYIPLVIHELEQGITTTFVGIQTGSIFTQPAPDLVSETPQNYILRADDLRLKAEEILQANAALSQTQRPSSRWVRQVQDQIKTLPAAEQALALKNFLAVGYSADAPRNKDTLLAFVDLLFPGVAGQPLKANLQSISEVEVRHVYEILSDIIDAAFPLDASITEGMFRSLDCREQIPFSKSEKTTAAYNSMLMPPLGSGKLRAARQAYAICQRWPITPAPAIEHQRLESNLPTLVFQGRYDTQTPTYMGPQTVAGLTNGTLVNFPNTGHGAIVYSQCAKDIGVSFINNPSQVPNTSCTANLVPKFVLPGATPAPR